MYLWLREPPLSVAALTPRVNSAVDAVLASRRATVLAEGDVPFGADDTVNILVLGIDSRKEGKEEHCDAIHMVSVDTNDWTVDVTSVPRGTYAYIPPGTYADNEYYIANACAFAGLDYGVEQIERVIGVQSDYVVTVGFSQTLGLLRALQLPTTESLQWLRHRQSYAIGDPQRSQNQAVFMKDVALKLFEGDGISSMFFHLLYSYVETDMDESTAKALYDGLLLHGIANRPHDVTLSMKPHFDVKEIHFNPDEATETIAALLARLEGRLSEYDLSKRSLESVQRDFVLYLEAVLAGEKGSIAEVVDQQLWRQVEDDGVRESLHYRYLEAYAQDRIRSDRDDVIQMIADYILEKQTLGLVVWETKGRRLLETLVD